MTEGISNTSFWNMCYYIHINFVADHLKTANPFTSYSFITRPKPHLIYIIKHPQNSSEDEAAQFVSKEVL